MESPYFFRLMFTLILINLNFQLYLIPKINQYWHQSYSHALLFGFHVVKPLMPIFALFPTLFNYEKNSNGNSVTHVSSRDRTMKLSISLKGPAGFS